jgi:hypothetical protein
MKGSALLYSTLLPSAEQECLQSLICLSTKRVVDEQFSSSHPPATVVSDEEQEREIGESEFRILNPRRLMTNNLDLGESSLSSESSQRHILKSLRISRVHPGTNEAATVTEDDHFLVVIGGSAIVWFFVVLQQSIFELS